MRCGDQTGAVQDLTGAAAAEKSELMSEVDRQNLTMQQLSADCEAQRAQLDSLTAQLQQSQLTLEVCATTSALCAMLFSCLIVLFRSVFQCFGAVGNRIRSARCLVAAVLTNLE